MSDATTTTDPVCDCGHPRSEHEDGVICVHVTPLDGTPCRCCGAVDELCLGRVCGCAEFEEMDPCCTRPGHVCSRCEVDW